MTQRRCSSPRSLAVELDQAGSTKRWAPRRLQSLEPVELARVAQALVELARGAQAPVKLARVAQAPVELAREEQARIEGAEKD